MRKLGFILLVFCAFFLLLSNAYADQNSVAIQRAEGERLAKAVGHYARARSLLLAAIREFDKGYQLADPSALVKVDELRNSILDKAEDLQRILAPQPRASKGGVRFEADTRLLGNLGEARSR